eukprot:29182_1
MNVLPCSLAFAAGVTVYLSFVTLIPESIEQFHKCVDTESKTATLPELYTLLCVILGLLITFSMETLFHHLGVDTHNHDDHTEAPCEDQANMTDSESQRADNIILFDSEVISKPVNVSEESTNYSRVSYSLAFALILHHFPEGIATFISLYYDLEFGISVALALILHEIPSGICIGVPIYLSSGSKTKPFILCFIAAIAYPIGAFSGWIIIETATGEFTDIFIAIIIGITGGIMLYISFIELLPTAIIAANNCSLSSDKNEKEICYKNVYTLSIVMLFCGFLVMTISNILLNVVGAHSH